MLFIESIFTFINMTENKTRMLVAEAHDLLSKYTVGKFLRYHSLGTGIAMSRLAVKLGQDVVLWECTGLVHDLDMELIDGDLSKHGVKTVETLKSEGYDIPQMFDAIYAHTEVLAHSTFRRNELLDFILTGTENLVGFISAYVAVRPSRSIIGAEPKSIVKKMKDKSFSNAVNRDVIEDAISHSKIERSEYIYEIIDALSERASEVGLLQYSPS